MNRTKKITRIFIRATLVMLCLLRAAAAFNYKTLLHIYHGFTLFEPAKVSDNFRSLDQRFPSKKVAVPSLSTSGYADVTIKDVLQMSYKMGALSIGFGGSLESLIERNYRPRHC